jgi:hypothetical protein
MFSVSRRSLIKGTIAGAGLAAFQTNPGTRFVRAQGANYEIVSFGAVPEGVLPEGFLLPQFGAVTGVTPDGTGFGRVAASTEKFTPALFGDNGKLTKLKSGKFGGTVSAVNSAGSAVGSTYDVPAGEDGDIFTNPLQQPVAWIDGEIVRLPVPAPASDSADLIGSARSISDEGVILGSGNGHTLLWSDGEPEILPTRDTNDRSLTFSAITAAGELIGSTFFYDQQTRTSSNVYGIINGSAIDPFTFPEEFSTGLFFRGTNSAGHVLYVVFRGGISLAIIAVPGEDPIIVNSGEDGVSFTPFGFNASNQVVGNWQARASDDSEPAIWQDGEFTPLKSLLPPDHSFHRITVSGISDDGIIAGSGWDEDGGFHPLLFIPG